MKIFENATPIISSFIGSPTELSTNEKEGSNTCPITAENDRSTILPRTNSLTVSKLLRSWLRTSCLACTLPPHLLEIDVSNLIYFEDGVLRVIPGRLSITFRK